MLESLTIGPDKIKTFRTTSRSRRVAMRLEELSSMAMIILTSCSCMLNLTLNEVECVVKTQYCVGGQIWVYSLATSVLLKTRDKAEVGEKGL